MADRIILVHNTTGDVVLLCQLPAEVESPDTNLSEVIKYAWQKAPESSKRGELHKAYIYEVSKPKQFTGSIHEISQVSRQTGIIYLNDGPSDSIGVSVEPRGAFVERRRDILAKAIQESADMHVPIFMPWVIEHNARQEELDKMSDEEKLGQTVYKMGQ